MTTSNEIVVDVRNLTRRFKVYHNASTGPLYETLCFWKRRTFYSESVVVNDVSLSIRKGEVVGLIGANGAGKTTLLKLIAGLLVPDSGSIDVQGNVTTLLAMGLVTDPEFTGLENIYYNGLCLGMSREQIEDRIPFIVEFSELKDFVHQPFRTYSMGMRARLLFSTMISVNPDIFIVDEALSTGDVHFVDKCRTSIRDRCQSGVTALFVSHNLAQIGEICDRCLVLDQGRIVFDGPSPEAIAYYVKEIEQAQAHDLVLKNQKQRQQLCSSDPHQNSIHIMDACFLREGERTFSLTIGESHDLRIRFWSPADYQNVQVQVLFRSDKSPTPFAICPSNVPELSQATSTQTFNIPAGEAEIQLSFPHLSLGDGGYHCDLLMSYQTKDNSGSPGEIHLEDVVIFEGVYRDTQVQGRGTLVEMPIDSVQVVTEGTNKRQALSA